MLDYTYIAGKMKPMFKKWLDPRVSVLSFKPCLYLCSWFLPWELRSQYLSLSIHVIAKLVSEHLQAKVIFTDQDPSGIHNHHQKGLWLAYLNHMFFFVPVTESSNQLCWVICPIPGKEDQLSWFLALPKILKGRPTRHKKT